MKILLGITGSISAYKSIEVARLLVKAGHEVRCIVTKGACEFIQPNILRYLGVEKTYIAHDDFNQSVYENINNNVLHIELSNWADQIVIAPLSANTLAKLANGFCDDLLSSVVLATTNKIIIIAPAMNSRMYQNPITQENLNKLIRLSYFQLITPNSGELACSEVGIGKLAEVEEIFHFIETATLQKKNKKVLISTGASVAPLDPVRFLTNPASGKTGFELAKQYLAVGYQVTVVSGPNAYRELKYLEKNNSFQMITGSTTRDLEEIILKEFKDSSIYISAAAFCDIEFAQQEQKIKKSQMNGEIHFKQAPDILKAVLSIKREDQKVIGFAAETNTDKSIFLEKWNRKPVDLLIGNLVNSGLKNSSKKGFATNDGEYFFVKEGKIQTQLSLTKKQLAKKMLEMTDADINFQ